MSAATLRAFKGTPPAFLLRGARLITDNPDCRGLVLTPHELIGDPAARRGPGEAQDDQEASGGPLLAPEPETPATEPPSPAGAAADAERQAALAELAQITAMSAEAAAGIDRLAGRLAEAKEGRGSGGMALKIQLLRLMARHNVRSVDPPPLPLLAPIDAPSIRIKGLAATADVDLDRTRFLRHCWPKLDPGQIKLVVGHDLSREVGTIEEIDVDAFGRVMIVATVTDKAAMRLSGLSISAMVAKHTIRDPDDRFGFRGEVERVSDVNEISLTATPANRRCIVTERWIPSPRELSNDALLAKLKDIQVTVAAMRASGAFASAA